MTTTTTTLPRWREKEAEIVQFIQENQPQFQYDYRDELNSDQIETILNSENGLKDIESEIFEDSLDYTCQLESDLKSRIKEVFHVEDMDEAEEEDFDLFVCEHICFDMNMSQLLRNTGHQVFFYDTGIETLGYGHSPAVYRRELAKIKAFFKLKDSTQDEKIMMMIRDASYGGQVVIYFNARIGEVIEGIKKPSVYVGDATIAIIDTAGGSGGDCHLIGVKLTLPFKKEKLFYEKSIQYNYTYAVCGMATDWCRDTDFQFRDNAVRGRKPRAESTIQRIKEQNAMYDKTFAEGGCTAGDMRISRHRDTVYVNSYPCGTHCPHCGTFWID